MSNKDVVKKQVIVALDMPTLEEAAELVDALKWKVRYFKVGSRLFTRYGTKILDVCAERGVEVFLDLKLYDIPSVVGDACANIAEHAAVFMTTVHAGGGSKMVRAAVEGGGGAESSDALKVVAVTALTSFSSEELPELGVSMPMDEWARLLAESALDAGADGLVCSPQEIKAFRQAYGADRLLVTPGIRLSDTVVAGDDQHRTATPAYALGAGSSFLVIGRPVYQAADPAAVVDAIASSLS